MAAAEPCARCHRRARTAHGVGEGRPDTEAAAFAEVQAACRLLAVAAVEESWRSATVCLQAVVAMHLAAHRARLARAFASLRQHAVEQRCAPHVLQQQLLPWKQSDSSDYLKHTHVTYKSGALAPVRDGARRSPAGGKCPQARTYHCVK